jgi:uncharacterized membrane protein (DUF106 family)
MITEFITAYPRTSIILLAFLVTLVMMLITKYFTDQDRMRELKKIQKACNIKLKENRHDDAAQKQLMECSMELMKHSFKPLLISFIPLIIFFWWIRGIYSGVLTGWLWWYIPAGIISSIILRKALKVA